MGAVIWQFQHVMKDLAKAAFAYYACATEKDDSQKREAEHVLSGLELPIRYVRSRKRDD